MTSQRSMLCRDEKGILNVPQKGRAIADISPKEGEYAKDLQVLLNKLERLELYENK